MKKFVAFLIVTIMTIMVGCQGKGISQNETATGFAQTGINATSETVSNDNASAKGTDNKDSVSSSSSKEQNSSTAAANNTVKGENKKVQTSNTQTAKPTEEQKKPESGSFTLFISKNRGTEEILRKKIKIEDNKCLMDYLRDNVSVIDDGGYIKSIEGFEAITSMELTSEQKKAGIMGVDWFLFLNGVKTGCGAYDIFPKNGDITGLDYREWTYKDLAP